MFHIKMAQKKNKDYYRQLVLDMQIGHDKVSFSINTVRIREAI